MPLGFCFSLCWNPVILINLLFVPGKYLFSASKIQSSAGLIHAPYSQLKPCGQTHNFDRHDSKFAIYFSLPNFDKLIKKKKKLKAGNNVTTGCQICSESPIGSCHAKFWQALPNAFFRMQTACEVTAPFVLQLNAADEKVRKGVLPGKGNCCFHPGKFYTHK